MNIDTNKITKKSIIISFLISLSFLVIFSLVYFISYIPNQPVDIDLSLKESRSLNALEVRSAGKSLLKKSELISKDPLLLRIPIDKAIDITIKDYGKR